MTFRLSVSMTDTSSEKDFHFSEDRRAVPLYRALFLINEEIRRGGR